MRQFPIYFSKIKNIIKGIKKYDLQIIMQMSASELVAKNISGISSSTVYSN